MEKFFRMGLSDQDIDALRAEFPQAETRPGTIFEGGWRTREVRTQVVVIAPHKWVQESSGSWHYAGPESSY